MREGPIEAIPLTAGEIRDLVAPMLLTPLIDPIYEQLAQYIGLLYRWNRRMNLTSIRDPRVMAGLHVGECLRCAQRIPAGVRSVLDFGSGAGLPGIPIQICQPELEVTLADSQKRKAAFLLEAVRHLELTNARVFSGRVEEMPGSQVFDMVTMRAVDGMDAAMVSAEARVVPKGFAVILTSKAERAAVGAAMPEYKFELDEIPGTRQRIALMGRKRGAGR